MASRQKYFFSYLFAHTLQIFKLQANTRIVNYTSLSIINIMLQYLLVGWLALAITVQPSTYIISQQFFTEGFTDNDCNTWSPFGPSIPLMKFSTCASHRIFGGYSIFVGDPTNPSGITRTFSSLIPHYSVTVTASLYKIDSWLNNTIFFMVDGVTAQVYTFTAANGGTSDFCGNPTPVTDTINTSFNDLIVPVSFTVSHTSSTFTLKIISNLVGTAGSWGIRNLNITMEACDQSCLTCSSATSCLTCDPGQGLTLSGPFCICTSGIRQKRIPCASVPCATCLATLPCSIGYYYSLTTLYCEPCNVACATCTSPVNSGLTCGTCKIAGFIRTVPGTACSSCFSGCLACTSTAANSCLSCLYGYYRDSGNLTCVLSCPTGTYGDEASSTCLPCSSPCVSCLGFNGGSYYCQSCIANYYLYSYSCYISCPYSLLGYQGICVASCPSATYPDSITITCKNCVTDCLECTNGTGCFICKNGTYLYNGICYTNCPVTLYGSNQTQLCLLCHTSCLTCNGPFSDNCLSCPGTHLILNVCYLTCPSNTYSVSCSPCDTSCLTCTGSTPYNCASCASPLFFHINFTACISTCNVGQISNNYNFTCTQCPFGMAAYFQSCQPCSLTCLSCNGITFLQCSSCNAGTHLVQSTCVLAYESNVIYMPNKANGSSIKQSFMIIFFIQFFLCLMLEALFQYKTNILLTIELLQILSYTQFLTIQLSQSTQRFAHFLYITNFAAFLNPITANPHISLPTKFQVIGKTGVFLADAFGIQLIMIICFVLYLGVRYLSHRSQFFKKCYQKINPYLLAYTFRLILLELALDIMLYVYCFDASTGVGVGSLVLLLIDLFLLVISLCWRIKTDQDGTQIALFYYNQVGQILRKQQQPIPDEQSLGTSVQQKIRKSKIMPSLMELLLKIPIPITILYFIGNPSTQTICFFIYFAFYFLLIAIVPVRRRIYRFIMLVNSSFLILNAFGAILVAKQVTSSTYFDGIWLMVIILLFIFTLLQVISNYHYFIDGLSYMKYQIKHGFNSKEPLNNNESQSNLESQDDQSVVFEKHEREPDFKKDVRSQSKLLSNSHMNTSWMKQKQ